jgi:hypothetical protein
MSASRGRVGRVKLTAHLSAPSLQLPSFDVRNSLPLHNMNAFNLCKLGLSTPSLRHVGGVAEALNEASYERMSLRAKRPAVWGKYRQEGRLWGGPLSPTCLAARARAARMPLAVERRFMMMTVASMVDPALNGCINRSLERYQDDRLRQPPHLRSMRDAIRPPCRSASQKVPDLRCMHRTLCLPI